MGCLPTVLAALAAIFVVGGVATATDDTYPHHYVKFRIEPKIQSVEVPSEVVAEGGTAEVPVKVTVTWTGNYPCTIKRTPTRMTFAVDGNVVNTQMITPPYKVGDTRTVSTTLRLTPGEHEITVTVRFPNLCSTGSPVEPTRRASGSS
ncbi:hypothetical protein [Methanopyrus kandleri]|uniref:Uncharacterized protein specific for M.kandleri, MK-24 family n=2 Tax=Methanopyrus kandleri TaxID=2320 RepID=Q8TW80_METKA|nr:hypothetical protein [Methanopyrus kandleri]AAM02369.1 Uncharacterized protein specific for M.kandleri, MK-24 family [Methanopyrus kandleri AV19]HII71120.1 hypothetical protein [Methanopyrus kandleri]